MPVNSEHPQYIKNSPRWELVRDVINSDVKKYIKDVDPTDPSRSVRYKDDAQFTNFSGRTKNALVGAIFRKEPLIDLPNELRHLEIDATGGNEPLKKLIQEITGEVLQTGRFGILTDFPTVSEDGLTALEVEKNNITSRFSKYPAESIINWKQENIKGTVKMTLIVLKEVTDDIDEQDGFKWISKTVYRVLELNQGVYTQSVLNEEGEILSFSTPLDADGKTWNTIPFEFVGSENNDSVTDHSPLYDMSRLNIGHLRNSADYEESVHISGQPTLFITTSMAAEEFEDANPNGVQIGARRGHNLGQQGSATFLQASPNQLADEAMKRKEQQAIMIGAKLITPQATNETAEAARMRHSGETSILSVIAKNVESAILKSIAHVLRFVKAGDNTETLREVRVELNDQFFDANLDPNMIMAQIQLADKGVIATSDIRNTLRKFGHLQDDRTDSEIDKEAKPTLDNPSEEK